jgi:asparagine synthase (glutamine-hydrolysing)
MCGIAGIYSRRRPFDRAQFPLGRMLEALDHRGPDDRGIDVVSEAGIGLIHTRLSVIDLSPAGHQPMWNDGGTVGLVFNGEIYNFQELRGELAARGAMFRSHTDTEVILKGYELWGIDIVNRLNGMFAIGLWDAKEKRLWLVRDRLGKKPLYYWHDAEREILLFASEIKALLQAPQIARRVDPAALQCYLALGYVPAPHTMFHGIKKLPAAHQLRFDGGGVEIQRYWKLSTLGDWEASPAEYRRSIRAAVMQAVERRLASDVPLGALFSGGVDSSIVVGLMSRLLKEPVRTFSAAFDVGAGSAKYNSDADAADIASKVFGTRHTRLTVRAGERLQDDLAAVVWHMDEPHANPTCATTYMLTRLIKREGITVALGGDGSDEIFAGYSRYLADRYVSCARHVPPLLRRALLGIADGVGKAPRWSAALRKAAFVPRSSDRYLTWWNIFSPAERATLLAEPYRDAWDAPGRSVESALDGITSPSDQAWLCYADMALWQAEESNMRLDKMSMAHGLEVRSPFQDYTLVEQAMSIPFEHKVGWRSSKRLLKEAFADLIPQVVLHRPKQGWQSPVYHWVRGTLRRDAERLIGSLAETGVFTPEVHRLLHAPPIRREQKIWALMMFALWHERWISGGADNLPRRSYPDEPAAEIEVGEGTSP